MVLSVLTPQLCAWPALTCKNVPVGGTACPLALYPQQTSAASVLTAQVWFAPALTCVKVPVGAAAWPKLLAPQQETVPSVSMAQVWAPPALTVGPATDGSSDQAIRASA